METFKPDPNLLEALAELKPSRWSGGVWRHTFADNPPDKANGRGARWNPPGTDALYASLERDTTLAEAEHQMASQPIRPMAKRTIHQLELELSTPDDALGMAARRLLNQHRYARAAVATPMRLR